MQQFYDERCCISNKNDDAVAWALGLSDKWRQEVWSGDDYSGGWRLMPGHGWHDLWLVTGDWWLVTGGWLLVLGGRNRQISFAGTSKNFPHSPRCVAIFLATRLA